MCVLTFFYRTLLHIEDGIRAIEVSYVNQAVVLDFNDTVMLTLEMLGTNIWKSFALTFHGTMVSLHSVSNSSSIGISPKDFIEDFSAVTIGEGFSGLLQDITVYDSPLDGFTLPADPVFLPQCYCQSPSSITSSGQCSDEDDKTTLR